MATRKDKIVVLDAGTLDFGDIAWDGLKRLGSLRKFHSTKEGQILKRVGNAGIVISNKCPLTRKTLKKLKVKLVCVSATGTNNVDLEAARELGITVTNVTNYTTESMAQGTFAFILNLAGRIFELSKEAKNGTWSRSPFFTVTPTSVSSVEGKTLGILGYGHIGKRVAQLAKAFKMKVLIGRVPGRRYAKAKGPKRVAFDRLIRESNFLTVHTPLTPLTDGLIDKAVLCKMKPSAYLINTARGGIVEEKALGWALRKNRIAGAAFDVLAKEPPVKKHPLFKAPRLILTPHAAWTSPEVRKRLLDEVILNIKAFQRGKKRNRVT